MIIEGELENEVNKESKPQVVNNIIQGKAPAHANINQALNKPFNLAPNIAGPLGQKTDLRFNGTGPPQAAKAPPNLKPPSLANAPSIVNASDQNKRGVNNLSDMKVPVSGNVGPNAPKIPENKETPTADSPDRIFSLNEEKKERSPQLNQPTISLEFLKTLRKYPKPNTSTQEIREISKFFNIEQHSNLLCSKCKNFKLKFRLECLHNTCLYCFSVSVESFKTKPSVNSFKKLSCPTCSLNFSKKDIKAVFGERYQKEFFEIPFSQRCLICEFDRQLVVDYFTELPCLHLCKSCYANELYSRSKNCPCCQQPFISVKNSMNRISKCACCSKKSPTVESSYRSIHKGHMLCFMCLQDSVKDKACKACDEDLDPNQRKYAVTLFNKFCSVCKRKQALPSFTVKECCPYFVCEDCQADDRLCKACSTQLVSY